MCQPHKMVKHTETICRLLPTNCLTVFDHFVGLGPKGLNSRKKKLMTIIFNDYYVSSILKLSDRKGSSVDRVNQIKIGNKIWK